MRIDDLATCRLLPICCIVGFTVGCGGGSSSSVVEMRRSAQEAYDDGIKAYQSKDFPTAEQRFSEALEAGGLYPDLYDSARAKQAAAMAAQGKFEAAETALANLEAIAEQKDLVYATRSYVLEKQGKIKAAKAAWAKAKRMNRYVKKISD